MNSTNKTIYLDHAATTPVSAEVLSAMLPYFCNRYGNPSSNYGPGREAKQAVEHARAQVAAALGCTPQEIFFTSCGSESDNWVIKSTAHRLADEGKRHLITTAIEHHAVLHGMAALEKEGFAVTYLPVDRTGLVTAQQVQNALRPDTALVTIMYANNEIGTIQPIAEIGSVCQNAGVLFHTDAVQAVGAVPIDVYAQNIDALSLSAHKFNGPKGVGALYLKKGTPLPSFIDGGAQENGRRAGTENVAGIVGLGTALELATAQLAEKAKKLTALRDNVIHTLTTALPNVALNGHPTLRLPNNVNLSFEGIEGEGILMLLDMRGICVSTGSACASGSLDPSHVLLATGLPHEIAHGSLRLSFGAENTMQDAQAACEALQDIVPRLRAMSPVWGDIASGKKPSLLR